MTCQPPLTMADGTILGSAAALTQSFCSLARAAANAVELLAAAGFAGTPGDTADELRLAIARQEHMLSEFNVTVRTDAETTRYHERRAVLVRAREAMLHEVAAASIRRTCTTGDGSLRGPCPTHPPTTVPTLIERYKALLPDVYQHIDFSNCRPGRPLRDSSMASTQLPASLAPSSPSDRTGG